MSESPRVALFVTCLVDLFRPNVGFATVKLLDDAGCEVFVPDSQTCCGQPAYNNGDFENAKAVGRLVLTTFEDFDYVVAPSGSCTGMLKVHYPTLFQDDTVWCPKARRFAEKCHEIVEFLTDVLGVTEVDASYRGQVVYHDSCSSLRELKLKQQPRQLLAGVRGLSLLEMRDAEQCCGFGGTFCVKYPEISMRLVSDKAANIDRSGADTVVASDLGCLLNIAGRLKRQGSSLRVFHVAEVLAGLTSCAGIGDKANSHAFE